MKSGTIILIVAVLFVAGVVGGFVFISQSGGSESGGEAQPAAETSGDAADAQRDDEAETDSEMDRSTQHGKAIEIPDNPAMCKIHHVPEVVDPFCNPDLIEYRGWCGGHDVAEALCTRCSPVLIAAFKAEGDWCAEHGLPESQCVTCNPELGDG